MELLDRQRITNNAFRVLGLPADASQADVEGVARRMRIWAEPSQIPPTEWDLPWLGPLVRSRMEIESAVARINDPAQRIRERLFWFSVPAVVSRGPLQQPSGREGGHHDEVLAELASALMADGQFKDERHWTCVINGLRGVVRSSGYNKWFMAAERAGNFEKQVTLEEVGVALAGLPDSVAQFFTHRACDALDEDDTGGCRRLVELMRRVASDLDAARRCEKKVADRAEDLVVSRCNVLCVEIYKSIDWHARPWPWVRHRNRRYCRRASRKIATSIDPLVELLTVLHQFQGERGQRIGTPMARMLRNLGLAWSVSLQSGLAKKTFRRAIEYVPGTPLAEKLKGDLNPRTTRLQAFVGGQGSSNSSNWRWVLIAMGLVSVLRIVPSVVPSGCGQSPQSVVSPASAPTPDRIGVPDLSHAFDDIASGDKSLRDVVQLKHPEPTTQPMPPVDRGGTHP